MAWPSEDCNCVQGIEHFIDPRIYNVFPEELTPDNSAFSLVNEEDLAASLTTAATSDTNVIVDSERCLKLVAQGTTLINNGYVRLVAYQVNSYFIQLDSLDKNWRSGVNVSLVFSHEEADKSITIPVMTLGTPIPIPREVLVPGKLNIAALAIKKLGEYSIITTEALSLNVYDPGISKVTWGELRSYDVYYYFQSLVKQLLAEVKNTKENIKTNIASQLLCTITDTTVNSSITKAVNYNLISGANVVTISFPDLTVVDLNPLHAYTVKFTLPFSDLGLEISAESYTKISKNLGSMAYVLSSSEDTYEVESISTLADTGVNISCSHIYGPGELNYYSQQNSSSGSGTETNDTIGDNTTDTKDDTAQEDSSASDIPDDVSSADTVTRIPIDHIVLEEGDATTIDGMDVSSVKVDFTSLPDIVLTIDDDTLIEELTISIEDLNFPL